MKKKYDPVEYRKRKQRQRERAEARRQARIAFGQRTLTPLLTMESKDQRENAARMQLYIMSEKCKLPLEEKLLRLREYLPSDAPFLSANNPEARIRFERIFGHHVRMWGHGKTAHFVTLAPRQFAVPVSLAANYDVFPLQQWACQIMRSFNFIGNVEVAFYSSDGRGGKTASFHVHVIVFDADKCGLQALKKRINDKYEAVIASASVMHVEQVTDGDLAGLSMYMTKESIGNYRAYDDARFVSTWVKEEKRGHDAFDVVRRMAQKKQPANPKTQLAIRRITRGQHMDKLIFAGGECAGNGNLLFNIRKDLLVGLPHSKRADREARFSGYFEGRTTTLRYNSSPWVRAASGFHHAYFDEVNALVEVFGHPDFEELERDRLARGRRLKRLRSKFAALAA